MTQNFEQALTNTFSAGWVNLTQIITQRFNFFISEVEVEFPEVLERLEAGAPALMDDNTGVPGLHSVERLLAAKIAALSAAYLRDRFPRKLGFRDEPESLLRCLQILDDQTDRQVRRAAEVLHEMRLISCARYEDMAVTFLEADWHDRLARNAFITAYGMDRAHAFEEHEAIKMASPLFFRTGLRSALASLTDDLVEWQSSIAETLASIGPAGSMRDDELRRNMIGRVVVTLVEAMRRSQQSYDERVRETINKFLQPYAVAFVRLFHQEMDERISDLREIQVHNSMSDDWKQERIAHSRALKAGVNRRAAVSGNSATFFILARRA
jgi:hypothetical protein